MATQNVEIDMLWGNPKSPAVSPFNRVPTTSYSTLIKTMRLSRAVFELYHIICQKSAILTYPICNLPPHWGNSARISLRHLASDEQITRVTGLSCGIVAVLLYV